MTDTHTTELLEALALALEATVGSHSSVIILHFTWDENLEVPEAEFPVPSISWMEPLEIPEDGNFASLGFSYFLRPIADKPGHHTFAVPFIVSAEYNQQEIDAYLSDINADPDYPGMTDVAFAGINKFVGN